MAVASEPEVEAVEEPAEPGPGGGREDPTPAQGGVGAAEDLHAANDGAVGEDAVDLTHDLLEGEVEGGGVEGGVGDVDEAEAASAFVEALHEGGLARAEGALAVDEDGELGCHRSEFGGRRLVDAASGGGWGAKAE